MTTDLNKALGFLCGKYSVASGEIIEKDGVFRVRCGSGDVTLLPWRVERRFTELGNLIANRTLEDVSTFRFSSMTAGGRLMNQVVRELDLAAWLGGAPVVSLFAVCSGDAAANVIAKLANDISASIECNNKLPAGAETIDRHEIIARRGIASDRVVDTQVPQASIYTFTGQGGARYTDTDAELFGLGEAQIRLVRAAFAALSNPALGDDWNAAAAVMDGLAEAVRKSDSASVMINLQGGKQI
jgi:predicted dehydrogenase